MPFLKDLLAGGGGKLIDSVGKVLDNVITTKEERIKLENELKKAEMEYELEKSKLSIQEQTLYLQDTSNARYRENTLQTSANASKLGKNITSYLAITATILCFALFYILVFQKEMINATNKDIIIYVLGVLSALLTQVYSYFFGSSSGSADKNRTISQMLEKENSKN